ncbi:enolase C-terminal domain-like protein [Paenibacillus roseipurpureus]|uniref:Enolase C-terminal domain-like protein n=1 Tax=Paenibacillus roseopurpureus TaxID=2918901 RepID=A0AA96LPR6_9BACL|nr:enolase C-terminal domain-like protein [Paenibacillus sp. MBLB1832]WNR45992.1 enolase C-terminal domain-like protein [Paenibacillus sp. MBLB1832]
MKIKQIEIMKIPPSWVWVRVDTDEGIYGLGEPYLENHPDQVISEVHRLVPLLIGEDPTRTEYLWHKMYTSGSGYRGGPIKMSAISGLDMAFWDIKGKASNLPIHRLLGGGFRDKVKMYRACGSKMPHSVDPGDPYRLGLKSNHGEQKSEARNYYEVAKILVEEWGFQCLKLHFDMGESIEGQLKIKQFIEIVEAVREAVGYAVDIAIDIHNPHPRSGLKLAQALEPYFPLFLEEPIPMERIDQLRQVVDGTTIPIAAGERWMGKWAFHEAIQKGAAVLQPDIAHAGGFTELKKIAGMAEAAFATMAPHCPLSPLSIAASIQLAASIPNFLVQEHNEVNDARVNGQTVIGLGYFQNPFVLDNTGCVAVPEKPGLGIELSSEGLETIMSKPWSVVRG